MNWDIIILALIGLIQAVSLALIAKGRKEKKEERDEDVSARQQVAVKVAETAAVVVATKDIAVKTHDIANSRYSELREELQTSNKRIVEQNQQIMKLLMQRNGQVRSTDMEPQESGIIASETHSDVGNQEGAP